MGFFKNDTNNEVAFIKHNMEYFRFFENQRRFCDEISGQKFRQVLKPNGDFEKFRIVRENFILGIKRLNAYFVDNMQYIKNHRDTLEINSEINQLEDDFINDSEYQRLTKISDNLSKQQEVEFNLKYIHYLFRCFNLFTKTNNVLQISLKTMIQAFYIAFSDTDGFSRNLAEYRSEVANNISDLKYQELSEHIKKIASYYYTYSYLVVNKHQVIIDDLLNNLVSFIYHKDVIKRTIDILDGNITDYQRDLIRNDMKKLKKAFNIIYYLVNFNLSNKRILPKIQEPKLIDKTLI